MPAPASTPATVPPTPAREATSRVSAPVPHATSSTLSPGRIAAASATLVAHSPVSAGTSNASYAFAAWICSWRSGPDIAVPPLSPLTSVCPDVEKVRRGEQVALPKRLRRFSLDSFEGPGHRFKSRVEKQRFVLSDADVPGPRRGSRSRSGREQLEESRGDRQFAPIEPSW